MRAKSTARPVCASLNSCAATSLGKLCASDHAMNAIDEMSALKSGYQAVLLMRNGAAYPVWQALEAEAGRYLR